MDQVAHSPSSFHVAAVGPESVEVFAGGRPTAPGTVSHGDSQIPSYFKDANVWWSSWVPVAATGWGALVVVVPLIAVHFLVCTIRRFRPG